MSRIVQVPFGVEFTFTNYPTYTFSFADLPCRKVAQALATTLVQQTSATGPLTSPRSVQPYCHAARDLLLHLGASGFTGPPEAVPPELLYTAFRDAESFGSEVYMRRLIQRAEGGTWDGEAAAMADGTPFHAKVRDTPTEPYSVGTTKRLRETSSKIICDAEERRAEGELLLNSGPAPRDPSKRYRIRLPGSLLALTDPDADLSALKEAAQRLLDAEGRQPGSSLAKSVLFREAGVPRHRGQAGDLKAVADEFRAKVLSMRRAGQGPRGEGDLALLNEGHLTWDQVRARFASAEAELFAAHDADPWVRLSLSSVLNRAQLATARLRAPEMADALAAFQAESERRTKSIVTLPPWEDASNLVRMNVEQGPLTYRDVAAVYGADSHAWFYENYAAEIEGAWRAVFPATSECWAMRTLLGLATGIPPEGLADLQLDDIKWNGRNRVTIHYRKERGSGKSAATFTRSGRLSAPTLVERWLALTKTARGRLAEPDASYLWICVLFGEAGSWEIGKMAWGKETRRRWAKRHELKDDRGQPLVLDFHRIRATYFAEKDRAYHHALPIDPNHSRSVEDDHYVGQTRRTEVIEATIEAAQRDALRKADVPAPLVIATEDELARLASNPVAASQVLDMTPGEAAELINGERDVFLAGCKNFFDSPYSTEQGSPCPVPPWVCILCPLAVFTPEKLPNLLRLNDFLHSSWTSLAEGEFTSILGPVYVRLNRDILPRFSDVLISAARAVVTTSPPPFYLPPEMKSLDV